MNLEEAREALYGITAMYFQGAAVIWAEQMNTTLEPPYVTLKTGSLGRSAHPLEDEDGGRYYPCHTTVEVNLYTKGKPVTTGKGVCGNHANTAASDLMAYFDFVESEEVTDRMAGLGIEMTLIPPVRDLTGLLNERKYRYRAMAEATVTFAMEADGLYGIGGMPQAPDHSGGGTAGMAQAGIPAIEGVVVEDMTGRYEDEE